MGKGSNMSTRSTKALAESMAAATRHISDRKAPNREERQGEAPAPPEIVEPNPTQKAHARFDLEKIVDKRAGGTSVTIGTAYRRKPMIDVLASQGVFSDAEHKALTHYRHHADIADRSPTRDSLDRQRHGGSGTGQTIEMLNAVRVRDDCERAAGSLADILRAVVVDDWSLTQWALKRYGSSERAEKRKDDRIRPKDGTVMMARMEIQIAARRVQAELDA